VTDGHEVGVLGKPIDDGEDHRLAIDTRKALDEIHGHMCPNGAGHVERLEQARWVQVFDLIPLLDRTGPDMFLNHRSGTGNIEVMLQAVERLLRALMSHVMDC
jgi:hypothetical protein